MTTLKRIEELEALAAKATPGPWTASLMWAVEPNYEEVGEDTPPVVTEEAIDRLDDVKFIAASRTAVPELCAIIRELLEDAAGDAERATGKEFDEATDDDYK